MAKKKNKTIDAGGLGKEYPASETLGGASLIRETGKVGKRGTVVIAASLRRRFGLEEGSLIIEEEREDGVLIRPALAMPVEIYTKERQAEFLLTNAIDEEDYQSARKEVEKLGLDPDQVPHVRPGGSVSRHQSARQRKKA